MKLRTCLALLRLHGNLLLEELLQDPVLRTAWEIEWSWRPMTMRTLMTE